MAGDPFYARQKSDQALSDIVAASGTLRHRLCMSYLHHLSLLSVHKMPWSDLQDVYDEIEQLLLPWMSESYRPDIQFSDDLSAIANRFLHLHDEVLKRVTQLDELR